MRGMPAVQPSDFHYIGTRLLSLFPSSFAFNLTFSTSSCKASTLPP